MLSAVGPELPALLLEVARGDEDAFRRFYEATHALVYDTAVRVLRDHSHAAEVTQEVYLSIWLHADRYDPTRGSVPAWICTQAHHRAVGRVRSANASAVRDQSYASRNVSIPRDDTSEQAHAELDASQLHALLHTLSQPQREAVTLSFLHGHSHSQVAQLLHIPLGTAKTRIRDGLLKLRAGWEGTARRG